MNSATLRTQKGSFSWGTQGHPEAPRGTHNFPCPLAPNPRSSPPQGANPASGRATRAASAAVLLFVCLFVFSTPFQSPTKRRRAQITGLRGRPQGAAAAPEGAAPEGAAPEGAAPRSPPQPPPRPNRGPAAVPAAVPATLPARRGPERKGRKEGRRRKGSYHSAASPQAAGGPAAEPPAAAVAAAFPRPPCAAMARPRKCRPEGGNGRRGRLGAGRWEVPRGPGHGSASPAAGKGGREAAAGEGAPRAARKWRRGPCGAGSCGVEPLWCRFCVTVICYRTLGSLILEAGAKVRSVCV